jgi:hypothetical protein
MSYRARDVTRKYVEPAKLVPALPDVAHSSGYLGRNALLWLWRDLEDHTHESIMPQLMNSNDL